MPYICTARRERTLHEIRATTEPKGSATAQEDRGRSIGCCWQQIKTTYDDSAETASVQKRGKKKRSSCAIWTSATAHMLNAHTIFLIITKLIQFEETVYSLNLNLSVDFAGQHGKLKSEIVYIVCKGQGRPRCNHSKWKLCHSFTTLSITQAAARCVASYCLSHAY